MTALRVRPFLKADVADAFLSVGTLLGAVAVLGLAWAGHIARIQTRAQAEAGLRTCAESLDDGSDGRIALERLDKPEGWYSLEDLEKGRDR